MPSSLHTVHRHLFPTISVHRCKDVSNQRAERQGSDKKPPAKRPVSEKSSASERPDLPTGDEEDCGRAKYAPSELILPRPAAPTVVDGWRVKYAVSELIPPPAAQTVDGGRADGEADEAAPGPNDCISTSRNHHGTKLFREEIAMKAVEHAAASKEDKSCIVNELAKRWKGRFYREKGKGNKKRMIKLSDKEARKKIGNALRDAQPDSKAKKRAYNAQPDSKAKKRAREAQPEYEAKRRAWRIVYEAQPENKARKRENERARREKQQAIEQAELDARQPRYHAYFAIGARAKREKEAAATAEREERSYSACGVLQCLR